MSLQDDIRIDESAIDVEILRQPELMKQYLQIEAEKKNALDRIEEELDLASVELDRRIRAAPDKYELTKVTESTVLGAIKETKKYQKLKQSFLDARHEYNNAKSCVRSIEVKKSSLEYLVRLHGQQYFAGPSVPRDLEAERKVKESKSNAIVLKKMKNKKKKK